MDTRHLVAYALILLLGLLFVGGIFYLSRERRAERRAYQRHVQRRRDRRAREDGAKIPPA